MSLLRQTTAVASLAALTLFAQLGHRGLNEPDEARIAGISREMISSGDWLVPRIYDHAHFNKPPLANWLIAASFKLGGLNEWTARLPAALSALACVLFTMALAARILEREKAFAAGLALLTSPLFFGMSQIIDYNMLLTLLVTASVWSSVAWMQDGRAWQRSLFYLFLALAFLTKGPVGPAIVAMALIGYRFGPGEPRAQRPLWHGPSALAASALALSWFLVVAFRYPELWSFFLKGEIYNRVFSNEHHRNESFFFYFLLLPAGLLPWLRPAFRGARNCVRRFRDDRRIRLLACWVALPFIMFTIGKSKLPTYILPLYPALALILTSALKARTRSVWIYSVSMLAIYHLALGALPHFEPRMNANAGTRELCAALRSELRPGDRVALLETHPYGPAFYLGQPVSVPLYKFALQIASDQERVADKDFQDPKVIFDAFDRAQRVFILCSPRVAEERRRDAKRPVYVLARSNGRMLISNEPASGDPAKQHDAK